MALHRAHTQSPPLHSTVEGCATVGGYLTPRLIDMLARAYPVGQEAIMNDSRCPVCDLIVSVPPGGSVPIHRAPGEQGSCAGTGQSSTPR
ncbi:hypothetical protein [Saccharomonospora piscinae]|uniref:hypothetical protein n=1 Tax=Saccharomonospora piscinae TaxID=687388 RepID=UPI00111C8A24|nr:hypothetical protein [Saccharomonospora piscinae]